MSEDRGLYDKYDVRRNDARDQHGEKHEGCRYFVLDLTHDEQARNAAAYYAANVAETRPELADDLDVLLANLDGPTEPLHTGNTPLEERTKEELYELASRLEVSGRSKMSKDELVQAIREVRDE